MTRVLVTRTPDQAGELVALLEGEGIEPVLFPTIEVELLHTTAAGAYDWVVFTSANALRAVERLPNARVAVVGAATADALGRRPDFIPSAGRAAALARELPVRPGERVLWLRSELADAALVEQLRTRGAVVDDVVAYRVVPRTAPAPELRDRLLNSEIDALVLASPSAARGLVNACGADAYSRAHIVSIGPTTSAAVRALGLEVAAEAETPSAAGLLDAVRRCIGAEVRR